MTLTSRTGIAVLGLALVAPGLTGCGLFHKPSQLEQATEYLPSSTTALVFTDRAAVADRLGVGSITGRDATEEDVKRYAEALQDQAWGSTALGDYLPLMADGPFNELDIDWEVSARIGSSEDGGRAYVWKAEEDLDLKGLERALEEVGYTKDETDGIARYSGEKLKTGQTGLLGDRFPEEMRDVLVDPDEHLVVGSGDPDTLAGIAETVKDDADSLADDAGDYADLIDRADDAEFAAMSGNTEVCQPLAAYGRLTPAKAAALKKRYAGLGHPEARALIGTGDPLTTHTYLEFASDDAAEADASARQDMLDDGSDLRSNLKFSDLGNFEAEQDGDLVVIDGDWKDGVRPAVSAELTGGGPAACLPED